MMVRARKKVVDPAVTAKQKVKRIQVHLRHNGHRIFFGGYSCKDYADFARDFSEFLTRYCQDKTLTGGYHHCRSPGIFLVFELPPHKPLAPICKQLANYNAEDQKVVRAYTDFACHARERIREMLQHLTEKPVEIGLLNSGNECCVTWSRSFTSVSEAKKFLNDHYSDWVMLAELVDILGTEGIMTRFLTRFSEGSSLKDFPGDSHHQTSELQRGILKNPSLGYSEHNTAVEDHSTQSQISQSAPKVLSVFDSSFDYLEACQINPVDLPPISSEAMPGMMSLSEARRYLDEHFLDNHWLILAEIVKSFGIDTVSLLFEDPSFEQEYQAGCHKEASVTNQEGNFSYVGFEHRQNYATWGDLAGLSSNINGGCVEQVCFDQSSGFVSESSLRVASLEPCGTSPLSWPCIMSEVDMSLNQDSEQWKPTQ